MGNRDALTGVTDEARADGQLSLDAPTRELASMILGALVNERALLGHQVTEQFLETIVDSTLAGWWRTPRQTKKRSQQRRTMSAGLKG